jgi:hypothetical protein
MTDHGCQMGAAEWHKSLRATQFYSDAPRFLALPSYEWTGSAPSRPPGKGHRNVIFANDADAAKFVAQDQRVYGCDVAESRTIDKVWNLLRTKGITDVVTIPHHTADKDHPMDWNYHDPDYQTVVEIFQCRGSCEYVGCPLQTKNCTSLPGSYVLDALNRGYKMGFIASGDHNSMGIGVAALYVREISRQGIIEALKARRCFATTGDRMFADFRVNGRLMGEELQCAGRPRFTARIEGTKPLTSVVLFCNGRPVFEKQQKDLHNQTAFDLQFTAEKPAVPSFYYVRAIQADEGILWSSPVFMSVAK